MKKNKSKKIKDVSLVLTQRSGPEKVVFGIALVIFIAYALTLIIPYVWLFVQSLFEPKSYVLDYVKGPFRLPEQWHFSNYVVGFTYIQYDNIPFIGMIINSLVYIVVGGGFGLLWPICTGYVFAKYRFKGRELIYSIAIFCMTVPIVGSSGAYFRMIAALNLYDKGPLFDMFTSINTGFGGNFLLMYGIFKSISWSYAEAVFIDGGNDYTVFFRIMLPQALPAISALAITSAIGLWNEYYSIIMYKPSFLTVAAGLYYVQLTGIAREGLPIYYACLIITMIPVILLFSLGAEGMMKNLSIGGLKG